MRQHIQAIIDAFRAIDAHQIRISEIPEIKMTYVSVDVTDDARVAVLADQLDAGAVSTIEARLESSVTHWQRARREVSDGLEITVNGPHVTTELEAK